MKNELKNVSEQIKEKLEKSQEFCAKIDKIMNGQIIFFVKHGKVNTIRVTTDEMWEEIDSNWKT